MKVIIKKIIVSVLTLGISTSILSTPVSAQTDVTMVPEKNSISSSLNIYNNNIITPCADIIGWRYKVVDGKMYQRQYNYSRSTWIGEWELC